MTMPKEPSVSDTLRTDALYLPNGKEHTAAFRPSWLVAYQHASELERELAGARQAAIAEALGVYDDYQNMRHDRFKEKHHTYKLRDAIERLSTLPPAHQVVPVEPTDKMIAAGSAAYVGDLWVGHDVKITAAYKAMLEAARKA